MLAEKSRNALKYFEETELDYCPVAVKFCHNVPLGYRFEETDIPLCNHLKMVQESKATYYIDIAAEGCMGKNVMGAKPIEPFAQSGAVGFQHGIFSQQSCNARLYYQIECFKPHTVNYILFGPAAKVDFDPDLIIIVANTRAADIVMRALSYDTGDLYESKSTSVLGCHWLFNYPYMSGKANFMITGMHFGMNRAKLYAPGLHVISIPYTKFQSFFHGLSAMEWDLVPLKTDEASKLAVSRGYEKFDSCHDATFAVDPGERIR